MLPLTRSFGFAARSLRRQPARAWVGILGIAAVGALLLDMLLLSRGLVVSFHDLLDSIGFDVRVVAGELGPIGGPRLADASGIARDLGALPEIAEAVPIRMTEGEASAPGGRVGFSLMGMDVQARRPWTLASGHDLLDHAARPGSPRVPLILVNRRLAAALRASPGDQITVRATCSAEQSAMPPVPFRVVGVADFPFDTESQLSAVALGPAVRSACGAGTDDTADMVLVASREGFGADSAVSAIRRRRPDLHPATNDEIVARMQEQGFSYFRQISTVLSTITMLFGFMLITVLLTVSVNQRLAEIAALRALGFSQTRVALDILSQSALLVGTGGILALPLGVALSIWLDTILKKMPGIPMTMHFFVFEPRALVWHAGLLAVTACLAAAYPMWLVTRLSIASTLRNEVVS
ncbi:MAG TPA: FtsX-like permease family protein [Vicinamibacterales bacterium]